MSAPRDPAPGVDPALGILPDVGLRLPLHGAQLIEASAGTGKTFTLATLVLRLLLERGASISRMSIVTFTRAATQELRQRLRRRLRLARRLLDAPTPTRESDGEAAIAAAVLATAVARDGEDLVRQRLDAALLQLDDAMVSTIHGFCHRALREFGFRAGLLSETRVIDDPAEVWDEIAAELWRVAANLGEAAFEGQADVHGLLVALWATPEALAGDLPTLCDPQRRMLPEPEESDAAAALHALRIAATARFEAAMARRGESSQDQLIERLWRATEHDDITVALSARWPLLLIDEFQDTDPRQWDIFRRIYEAGDPEQRWLCLIGDPKQAIYRFRGGDLATYLRARAYVEHTHDANANAEGGHDRDSDDRARGVAALDANYRSTPKLLRAIETLFTAHALPFVEAQIEFQSVRAAGGAQDEDLRVGDAPTPGLTVHWLPPGEGRGGMRTRDDEFAMMADAAVRAIVELLRDGSLTQDGDERALRPADIAVLTQTNDQASTMRSALARAGIAAATIATASVFASDTAADLHALLAALADPADEARFRAALTTRLLGWDAAAIDDLDANTLLAQDEAARFAAAADTWRARGPLPALLPFLRAAASRWLGEHAGARRLTDALHLAELLQAESALRQGPMEQLRWFARQCALSTADETRQLRLESDAGLVQIATIHKSKGLEYPVVVLPFLAWRSEGSSRGLSYDDLHDAQGRPTRVWRQKDLLEATDAAAIDAAVEREERAEAQRQLYVALTRAQYALHVVWSRNARTEITAMHWLLHAGEKTGRVKDKLDHAGMRARIDALAAGSGDSIVVLPYAPDRPEDAERAVSAPRTRDERDAEEIVPAPRRARQRFVETPRLHSFSSLHARGEALAVARGADDEAVAAVETAIDVAELGGTAFGNAVHDVLEGAQTALWRRDPDDSADAWPLAQRALLERALLRHGLAPTPAHLAQTARLVARALNVALPGDVRLCDLPPGRQVRELGFHFRLRGARIESLYALLQSHGYSRERRPPPTRLEGCMHGFIDLVYRDPAGRHYVLDYKTNRLPAYDPVSLGRAIQLQDYDLQYLIYLIALRRWLRSRRGAAYDDARDLGGAVYLFLRGISLDDAADAAVSRRGVHVDPVPIALLAALDALLDGGIAHDGEGARA